MGKLSEDEARNSSHGQSIEESKKEQSPSLFVETQQSKLEFYHKNIPGNIQTLKQDAKKLILDESNGIGWCEQFAQNIIVTTLEFNNQSMKILLHYGNYQMRLCLILTELDEKIMKSQIYDSGSFGSIYEIQTSEEKLVIKGINYVTVEGKLSSSRIYKQYFMAKISSCLKAGPKIKSFFGYDMVFFKGQACFAMEMCSQSFTNLAYTQKDLLQNLQLLHSIGFMHLDIKPDNTAFSKEQKRFVFIDFGFSKLISEPLGRKTLSLFYGTLSYCSEQMRSVYYSGFPDYVDLYYNDIVSLHNSFQKKKKYYEITKKIMQDAKVALSPKNKKPISSLLLSTIFFLRLKFYIWSVNVSKAIELLKTGHQIHYTLCQTLSAKTLPRQFSQSTGIREQVAKLKVAIIQKENKMSNNDKYFRQFFKQKQGTELTPSQFSIDLILSLTQENFRYFVDNTQWAQKLFCVISPSSNYFPFTECQQNLKEIYEQRLRVIDKCFRHVLSISNVRPSKFQLYKSWVAIKFFYQKLKFLKNRELLTSFMLIFILTTDFQKIQEISHLIIDCTSDKKLKLLTIVQHQLFFDIALKYIQPASQKFMLIAEEEEGEDTELNLIRKFTKLILRRQRKYYEAFSRDQILPLLFKVEQIQGYEGTVNNIRFLYDYLAKTHHVTQKEKQSSTENSGQFVLNKLQQRQKTQSFAQNFSYLKIPRSEFYYFLKLFKPINLDYRQFFDESILKESLEEIFYIKKSMGKCWINFIDRLYNQQFCKRPLLFLKIIKSCKVLGEHMKLNRINVYYMLRNIYWFLDLFLFMIKFRYTTQVERENQQKILLEIEGLVRGLGKLSWEDEWLSVSLKCFEGIFLVLRGSDQHELQEKTKEIFSFMERVKCMDLIIISYFLQFFVCFEDLIKSMPGQHFIEKYVLKINKFFMYEDDTIFKINKNFLGLVILVNSKNNFHQKNIQLIEFVGGLNQGSSHFYQPDRWDFIQQSVVILCPCTSVQLLKDYFHSSRKKSIETMLIEEVYIQFHIFSYLAADLQGKTVLLQVARLFSWLERMKGLQTRKMLQETYRICRKNLKYPSKRKSMICLRKQGKYGLFYQKSEIKLLKVKERVQRYLIKKLQKLL